MRGNLLRLHEIASADKVSLVMTEKRWQIGHSFPSHSKRSKKSSSAQDRLHEEYLSVRNRLLWQSQEIAIPSVHNSEAPILSMQTSSTGGHSTNFYCKTVLMGDSHKRGWLVS